MMNIAAVIAYLTSNAVEDIELFPPVTDEEIIDFESPLKIQLPSDIKTFYKFANGLEGEWMLRILPLKDALYEITEYGEQYSSTCIPIAEYMIFSDAWILKPNAHHPDDYGIYRESDGKLVTQSFANFVATIITHGVFGENGLQDWCDVNI